MENYILSHSQLSTLNYTVMQDIIAAFQNDSAFYLINLLAFFVVGFSTWMLTKVQSNKDIAMLQTEIAKLELLGSEKINEKEDKFRATEEELRTKLKDFRNALFGKKPALAIAKRNELSHYFFTDYANAFYEFARLAAEIYASNSEKQINFRENHVHPFLTTSDEIMQMLNQDSIVQTTQGKTLSPPPTAFRFVIDYLEDHAGMFSFSEKSKIKKYKKRLLVKS